MIQLCLDGLSSGTAARLGALHAGCNGQPFKFWPTFSNVLTVRFIQTEVATHYNIARYVLFWYTHFEISHKLRDIANIITLSEHNSVSNIPLHQI